MYFLLPAPASGGYRMESHSLYFTRIFYLILLGLSNNIKITPLKITPSMGLFFFSGWFEECFVSRAKNVLFRFSTSGKIGNCSKTFCNASTELTNYIKLLTFENQSSIFSAVFVFFPTRRGLGKQKNKNNKNT